MIRLLRSISAGILTTVLMVTIGAPIAALVFILCFFARPFIVAQEVWDR